MLKTVSKSVQDVVIATLTEMGLCPAPGTLLHTLALSEGHLVAQKFFYDGGYAVWVAGRKTVSLYDEDGGLLRSVSLGVAEGGIAA
jgi:hypothetical protein